MCLLAEQQRDRQLVELHSTWLSQSLQDPLLLAKQTHGRQLLDLPADLAL